MKNCPSKARCGPTTCPPLRTSQLVAMKIAKPKSRPTTTPCTRAFRYRSWTRTASCRAACRLSSAMTAALRGRQQQRPGELPPGARALLGAYHEQHRGVPQEPEAPAADEASEKTVGQSEQAAAHGDAIAREVLAEERQGRADGVPALRHEEEGRRQQNRAGDRPDGESERHRVDLLERLGERSLKRGLRRRVARLLDDLLVVLPIGVDVPEVVAFAVEQVANRQQPRQHGVVLVVVTVQSVAADGLEVIQPIDEGPPHGEVLAVAAAVDRV